MLQFQEKFWDQKDFPPDGHLKSGIINKANCLKRLVSKKKRRLENEFFDIDLSYITKRVIAMGFPSTGCESFWRNRLIDVKNFLNKYHKDYKVVLKLILDLQSLPREK